MILKRFVDAVLKSDEDLKTNPPGKDWIPGTTKIVTYCSNASVYSSETQTVGQMSNSGGHYNDRRSHC